jgi:plasmid maintenance system killer protein
MKRNDWMRSADRGPPPTYAPPWEPGARDSWGRVKRQLLDVRDQFDSDELWRLYQHGDCPQQWLEVYDVLVRKLDMIQAATSVEDLAGRGRGLEILLTEAGGRWSIDIDHRRRIIFLWTGGGPSEIGILD